MGADEVTVRKSVAQNLKRIRNLRELTVRELSIRLKGLGLPLSPSGVSEVENAARKVGVEELLVFAVALNTSIVELITPENRELLRVADGIDPVPEAYLAWWLDGVRPWPKGADIDEFYDAASRTRQHDRMLRKRPDVKAVDFLAAVVYDAASMVEHLQDRDLDSKQREHVSAEAARLREALAKVDSYVNLLADEMDGYARGG